LAITTLARPKQALAAVRDRTLALIAPLDRADLERQLDPLMSPLVWDLAHIAAYEDLWCVHRLTGAPLLREDLAATYDAFETPRRVRGEIELLDLDGSLAYLEAVRARTLEALAEAGPAELHEMVLRHELQHTETMRQAMFLGGLPGGEPETTPRLPAEPEWVEVPGGTVGIGARGHGFAFDNERPRHEARIEPFRIARTPVANATWLTFAEGGGYERREWWSDEGWAWKEDFDITHPAGWERCPVDPSRPVMHVSWFEADAFARSQGARLPTEAEWEWAATWDQGRALDAVGEVWEWTASEFAGYPGFAAHPYREYSEVFFGRGMPVLRGGSWAAHPRVATRTFRNWDLPERRQIFSGVRLARDAA
jgi:gamma-glutamyl hercynylcysteine S-oxide synthase